MLPYTNFHDMNLTELIKFVKATIEEMKRMDKSIDEIRNYIDGLDLPAEVRREVDRIMNEVLTDSTIRAYIRDSQKWSNRKILWVTDSYGDGWDGTQTIANPYTRASNLLQCAFTKLSHGGDRFGDANTSEEYTFLNQIKNYVNSHSDMSSYTDVIIAGGANDICFNPSADLSTPIADTCTYIKTHFENAKITIAMVARLWNSGANNCTDANCEKIINQYKIGARNNHVAYLYGSELINHDYRKLASDGIHLVNYSDMGDKLADLLRNGDFRRWYDSPTDVHFTPSTTTSSDELAPAELTFGGQRYRGNTILLDLSNVIFRYQNNPIATISRGQIFKFATISGNANCRNTFAAGTQSFRATTTALVTYTGDDNNVHNENIPANIYFYNNSLYFALWGFIPGVNDNITLKNVEYIRLFNGIQFEIDEAYC